MSRLPLVLVALALVPQLYAKKRAEAPAAPPVGWYAEPPGKKTPGWRGECYFPPSWGEMDLVDRRMARQAALQAIKSQWSGQRSELVSFDPAVVEQLELTLLGLPAKIEEVATRNAGFCQAVMARDASTDAWGMWLSGLPTQLTAGQCRRPLDYQLVQYLRIDHGWQEEIPMCAGDRARIKAATNDRYRISRDGPWINADGDNDQPATDPALPCNREGCFRGQLVGLFVTVDGIEVVFPIGTSAEFEAPEHGTFSFAINDDSYADNVWYAEGTVTDHTAVTVMPAD
jgi:hypothetical protein